MNKVHDNSFNRTNVELKLNNTIGIHEEYTPFNRTNVELKLTIKSEDEAIAGLLIVPMWN